jgi:hypothetical protein
LLPPIPENFKGFSGKYSGSPEFLLVPFGILPLPQSSRAQAHATSGGEFPTSTLSLVDRVPNSTIVHVSCTPSKIPYVGISPIRLQTIILLNAFLSPVYIEHIYYSFVDIFYPVLNLEDVSPCRTYRPEPLRSISITETSPLLWAHPRILSAC